MNWIIAAVTTLLVATVCAQEAPPLPPDMNACSIGADLQIMLDSSSSIGEESFALMKEFVYEIVSNLDIGADTTRVSMNRYNSWVDQRFFFNTLVDKAAILEEVSNTPYYGRGTDTGKAILETASHNLQAYNGWRGQSVPTVVVLITDGNSQNSVDIPTATAALRTKTTRVITIGIGPNVVADELIAIASRPSDDNVYMLASYDELSNIFEEVLGKVCNVGEDVNECANANGGCEGLCVNVVGGFYCDCAAGYTLVGSSECADVNECDDNNGGCSDSCTNLDGGFLCGCEVGFTLASDGLTCVPDSCFEGNNCHHQCNNVVDGTFICSCNPGYQLADDLATCVDVDECAEGLSGCEHLCNNTDGGFFCACPEGLALRDDGKTCGTVCYVCENALSNDECTESVVCPATESACQTKTRMVDNQIFITKQCKQPEACANNQVQNPRNAVEVTQCGLEGDVSVCRCCCHDSYCNAAPACDLAFDSGIVCPATDTLEQPAGGSLSCTGNAIGDTCTVVCPAGYAPANGIGEIFCNLKPRSKEGAWMGEISPCVDINECADANGGCSHICTNFNGTYECSCPNENPCGKQTMDLVFVLDSSSSVGEENFGIMINFVKTVADTLEIAQGAIRVGVLTYNKFVTERIFLNDAVSNDDFTERLLAIEYSGRGTKTAQAIKFAATSFITAKNGRRAERPLVTVVITDGRTQDKKYIDDAVASLNELGSINFAIGVSSRVNEKELLQIVNGDSKRYRTVENFEGLSAELLMDMNFCIQSEDTHFMTSDGKTCDVDECAYDNGGCSDECANTIGSYVCLCPSGEELVNDGKTCDLNECRNNNGGCAGSCVNTLGSFRCLCDNEFVSSGFDCLDYNECNDANGGCSHECNNLVGGFECICPPGLTLDTDGLTCVTDNCFEREHPEKCEQICTTVPGGDYACSCLEGYVLSEDLHNCTEINECDSNNGGCQYDCINIAGGYECGCPEGMLLHEDGRSCVIKCYVCENAASNEECNLAGNLVTCPPSETSCFATMRSRGNETFINKGCKQDLACINNLIQNPRNMAEGPSQCNSNGIHSKCECCCFTSECNAGLCPYANELPTCPGFTVEDVTFRGLDLDGSILPGGVAVLTCGEGFAPSFGAEGVTQLNCIYDFANGTAAWDGSPDDFDVCVDIDECETDNGGCVAPAACVNFAGGHECVCPDSPNDYVLIDGTVCERDECADPDQGGCSHNCTNTIGSFQCFCPGELSLVRDGRTCDTDECRENNGGCSELCINTLGGNECGCHKDGYAVGEDGVTCEDVDECVNDNGGCSDLCENLDGGFQCACAPGRMMTEDGANCIDDPCFPDNGGCEQICVVEGDNTRCECEPGFNLRPDGTCEDIDECKAGISACSYNCTNTIGSFVCTCPLGTALDKDGITCGFACYSCHGAATNEECNAQPMEVCRQDSLACENEVRVHGGQKYIFKRCKQAHACHNNQIQNPRQAFLPTQCNGDKENDVCRCCCTSHMCNEAERVCSRGCNVNRADLNIILDSSSSVRDHNFNLMRNFVLDLITNFQIGPGAVHLSILRYNNRVDVRHYFNQSQDLKDVYDAVRNIPYRGSGTMTGKAIQFTLDNLFKTGAGMRPSVPQISLVMTDGKSADDVIVPSEALRASGVSVYAVGIGRVDEATIQNIAGSPTRAFMAKTFEELSGTLLDDIRHSLCTNQDECATNNGGCSHACVDTDGSYRCECPEDHILSEDLHTCLPLADNPDKTSAFDECAEDNGGCSHVCTDTLESFLCSCPPQMILEADNKTCSKVNECLSNPCEQSCVDTDQGFFCECDASHVLNSDGLTCSPRANTNGCPAGYSALGQTCVKFMDTDKSWDAAQSACLADGGRLLTVNDLGTASLAARAGVGSWIGSNSRLEAGVFTNTDGSVLALDNWAEGMPGDFNKCVFIGAEGKLGTDNCLFRRTSLCEIPRTKSDIVFMSSWASGAQVRTQWITGAPFLKVQIPTLVKSVTSWFCSVVRNEGSAIIFSQNDIERMSGNGACEFVFEGTEPVPAESLSVSMIKRTDPEDYEAQYDDY